MNLPSHTTLPATNSQQTELNLGLTCVLWRSYSIELMSHETIQSLRPFGVAGKEIWHDSPPSRKFRLFSSHFYCWFILSDCILFQYYNGKLRTLHLLNNCSYIGRREAVIYVAWIPSLECSKNSQIVWTTYHLPYWGSIMALYIRQIKALSYI